MRKYLTGKLSVLYISVLIALVGCKNNVEKDPLKIDEIQVKEYIQERNKENIGIEDQQIDDYLARREWSFTKTKSGLRYLIYQQGSGIMPEPNSLVQLEYTLNLIRGEEVSTSKESGPMSFIIDKEDVPSGLNEFVKMMKVGEKAKLIVPSYLGYGATGDDTKIPPRATLIYDLQLIRVIKN